MFVSLWDSFLLLCRFLNFLRFLERLFRPKSMQDLEQILQVSCVTFHRLIILFSHTLILLHINIPYIPYSSRCHHFYQNYSSSDCELFSLNYYLCLAFSFFFWMIGELVRISPWRPLFTLDGPEFDNFVEGDNSMKFWLVFLTEKPGWVLMGGRMQELRRDI
jgi:hypothetical protein